MSSPRTWFCPRLRATPSIRSLPPAGGAPADGLLFDIDADVFRHEPSLNLDRLQSFRMREFVRIGSPQAILEFRESWMARAPVIAGELGLPFTIDVASDPFFGRVGQVMAVSQRQQALKFELLIPYHATATPTACMSFNYHREHFGQVLGHPRRRRQPGAHVVRRIRRRPPCGRAVRDAWAGCFELATVGTTFIDRDDDVGIRCRSILV